MPLISTKYAVQYTSEVIDTTSHISITGLSFNKTLVFNNILKPSRILLVSTSMKTFIFGISPRISNLIYGKWEMKVLKFKWLTQIYLVNQCLNHFHDNLVQLCISASSSPQSYHPLCAIPLGYLLYKLENDWDRISLAVSAASAKYIKISLVKIQSH